MRLFNVRTGEIIYCPRSGQLTFNLYKGKGLFFVWLIYSYIIEMFDNYCIIACAFVKLACKKQR